MLAGCRSGQQYTSKPAKAGEDENIVVNAEVYHLNDSSSTVYVEIENDNLLYKRPDTAGVFYAHLKVVTHLMLEGNVRKILDSSSVQIFDRAGAEQVPLKSLYSEFSVAARFGNNYLLSIEVFDLNRRSRYRKDVNVYKASRLTSQNFLVFRNDSVSFGNTFLRNEALRILYADKSVNRLSVECFLREFGPALPPFSTKQSDPLKYKPDSIFELKADEERFRLTMPERGFYHLKAEPVLLQGLTLFTYDESFPGVSDNEEMIHCARYIMSREEYERCLNSPDKKKAIDDFWLGLGGSVERARELLRRYYNRVKVANRQYSSYAEGWKSDRGMIYIVFGQPVNIYKSRKDEVWVYGNESNPATLRFVFNKTENPFTDNDYMMERSQFYKEPWHSAVDFWRQGHVYSNRRR